MLVLNASGTEIRRLTGFYLPAYLQRELVASENAVPAQEPEKAVDEAPKNRRLMPESGLSINCTSWLRSLDHLLFRGQHGPLRIEHLQIRCQTFDIQRLCCRCSVRRANDSAWF